ncbi:MAG TPA: elongation factor P [Candidatus Latescibacteria bacterium]|nr:elongation factor P [Candidatus Latescibacterota bacterium]
MATTADFRNGMVINVEGDLFLIVEFQHVKPGKGGAFVRTKLRNVRTKAVLDRTFRAGERVEEVRLERKEMEYLYNTGDIYYFMDTETFEQVPIPVNLIGELRRFLKENERVSILMHGNNPVGIELPFFVELKVAQTTPGLRGDTVTGGTKPATLETGAVIQVPLFIKSGDTVKVDTRTGTYIERVAQ